MSWLEEVEALEREDDEREYLEYLDRQSNKHTTESERKMADAGVSAEDFI